MNNQTINPEDVSQVIIYTSLGFVLMALVLFIFFYLSRKKIIQYELDKRDLIIGHQKEMLSAIINTQEVERKRIAQDLHDDISSNLNIVSLNSHLLTKENLSEKEISEITSNIIKLTQKSLENSRRIAHDLYPPVIEKFGLHLGIEELCFDFSSVKNLSIEYLNDIDFNEITIEKQLQIFRILQELINNSMRHGKATNIKIQFSKDKNSYKCIYNDNGIGFDITNIKNQKGLGMKNIESRVNFLNGEIKFESKLNQGTTATFVF
jgi:signal transduction histidine kinase